MRHLTKECALLVALVLLAPLPIMARSKGTRESVTAIQPIDSETRLVLLSRSGWARIKSDRGGGRLRLRARETLTTVSETTSGWVAGGVHDTDTGSSLVVLSSEAGADGSTRERGSIGAGSRLPKLRQVEALQLRPVLLVNDGRLAGAAWLEGDSLRTLSVKFAEWTGVSWGPAATVSRPGPGSQTGLVGSTLRNGDLLLAWSRFDGSDDEIYWSRREGAQWTSPRRIGADNRSPDITPALAPSGRGATIVWSRLDRGEYVLVSRALRGSEWGDESRVSLPGSIFPTLVRSDDRLFAVYKTARPRGWAVSELGAPSAPVREARLETSLAQSGRRPVLTGLSPTGPVLRWMRPGSLSVPRWSIHSP